MSEAIWHRAQPELKPLESPDVGAVLAAVHSVALELLESAGRPPQRLLVRAADVEIELDWRLLDPGPVRETPGSPTAGPAAVALAEAPAVEGLSVVPDPAPGRHYVCSPSVGTFYRAAEPGATPFTVEGAVVRPQQTVGIVEAMKLMLPVDADRTGRIVEVLVEDGGSVEFGERLFLVEDVES